MLEETGLEVEVGPVVDVFDRILLDPDRKVAITTCSSIICAGRLAGTSVTDPMSRLPSSSIQVTSIATA